ncbi:MAG TPA: hypothetical protein VMY98_04900 [Anaerolineae bacterium]|nr:hypothetical protein [Anaerolineae bacterium]
MEWLAPGFLQETASLAGRGDHADAAIKTNGEVRSRVTMLGAVTDLNAVFAGSATLAYNHEELAPV